jgi:uncharacterized protein (DUF488 family)
MGEVQIWTIGHSKHELPVLVGLLRGLRIEVVADIRSQPFSRYNPQFNRKSLEQALLEAGIKYVFLGAELGGRPPEPEFYDADGHVRYGAVAATERFNSGIERLLAGAGRHRVAILCSEEDPAHCHRRLLVGRVLASRGIAVTHIRGHGEVVDETELGSPGPGQATLFGQERPGWRSVRPARRARS